MSHYNYTRKTIELIFGFMVIDEYGHPLEDAWDYEPDEEALNESGICITHFGSNFIPIVGIKTSHQIMDPTFLIYLGLG